MKKIFIKGLGLIEVPYTNEKITPIIKTVKDDTINEGHDKPDRSNIDRVKRSKPTR